MGRGGDTADRAEFWLQHLWDGTMIRIGDVGRGAGLGKGSLAFEVGGDFYTPRGVVRRPVGSASETPEGRGGGWGQGSHKENNNGRQFFGA